MNNRKERAFQKKALVKTEEAIAKKKYKCLYKDCAELAIKSHSQQRSGPLKSISESNKVYRLDDDLQRSYDFKTDKLKFRFALKGIGESSIFPGFCNEHEKIFSIFENEEIISENHRQFCVLFYRTLCYEKSRKRREVDRWDRLAKEFTNIYGRPQYEIESSVEAIRRHLKVSCEYKIDAAFKMMECSDYTALTTKHIKLPGNLNVSCSTVINLHLDDYAAYSRANPDTPLPSFTFNLLPGNNYTHIIISWLSEFDPHAQWLIKSIDEKKSLEILLNRLAFCDSEDACINPTLWESCASTDEIIRNMNHVKFRGELTDNMIPKIIKL